MRLSNTQYLVVAAATHAAGDPIAAVIVAATEVGVVVPSLLRSALESQGIRIVDDDSEHEQDGFKTHENHYRVALKKGDEMLAHGLSDSIPDALLHAAVGYVGERDIEQFGVRLPAPWHTSPPADPDDEEPKWATTPEQRANFAAHVAKIKAKPTA